MHQCLSEGRRGRDDWDELCGVGRKLITQARYASTNTAYEQHMRHFGHPLALFCLYFYFEFMKQDGRGPQQVSCIKLFLDYPCFSTPVMRKNKSDDCSLGNQISNI
jgi:hypothetical protein